MPAPQAAAETPLSPADFDFIRDLARGRAGIEIEDGKEYLVETKLASLVHASGLASVGSLVVRLREVPDDRIAERVVDALTINETSFFRDGAPFESIAGDLVPALVSRIGRTDTVDVWCAASSSGQEPYSLAIALDEQLGAAADRVRIIATDVSPTMIERCRAGRYSTLEVGRGVSPNRLARYFRPDGRHWVVDERIRSRVSFTEMNLTGPWSALPRCDLVLMRNVLIYFSVATKREILARVRRDVLRPGGYLVLGAAETTVNLDEEYLHAIRGDLVCYTIR